MRSRLRGSTALLKTTRTPMYTLPGKNPSIFQIEMRQKRKRAMPPKLNTIYNWPVSYDFSAVVFARPPEISNLPRGRSICKSGSEKRPLKRARRDPSRERDFF